MARRPPEGWTAARAAVLGLVLLLAAAGVAYASRTGRDSRTKALVIRVAHGPVTALNSQYIDTPPAGPSVGDLRTYYLPLTRLGRTRNIGYLTGTLTTTAIGRPRAGMELRTANLVFVIGRPANQLVVGGVAAYPQSASALAKKSVVTRPVIGGSGKYAGARGWCVTTHLVNNTWTHVFHVTVRG